MARQHPDEIAPQTSPSGATGGSEALTTVGLYLLLVALAVFAIALYKGSENGILGDVFSDASGRYAVIAGVALTGMALAAVGYRRAAHDRRRGFWLPLVANLLFLVLITATSEIGLRLVARPHPFGERIGSTPLLPYSWAHVSRENLALARQLRRPDAFYVEDRVLGWSLGKSRASSDRLYTSSDEGLRSAHAGEHLAKSAERPRVAIVGDSFAFSEEVDFNSSWGHALEQAYSGSVQVLNFGVPGYGVDQAYLRFRRDVLGWKPKVTIFAFISDNLNRNANVYLFLKPEWQIPFSKPRFLVDRRGELELLNVPNAEPEEVFTVPTFAALRYLEYEKEYNPAHWSDSWAFGSYLVRYAATLFPRWALPNEHASEDALIELGAAILARFREEAIVAGTRPVVVYLPTRSYFHSAGPRTLAEGLFRSASAHGVKVHDMTPCLLAGIEQDGLFVAGGVHYSPEGNRVLAACTKELIEAEAPEAEPTERGR